MVKAKNSDTKEATGNCRLVGGTDNVAAGGIQCMVDAFIRSLSLIHCGRVYVSLCERGYAMAFPYGRKHVMDSNPFYGKGRNSKFRCKILKKIYFFGFALRE